MHSHISPRSRKVSSAASSRQSVSGRSARSRASTATHTTATRSTAPSSVSASPARTSTKSNTATKRDTNITLRQDRRGKRIEVRVDNHTGNYVEDSFDDSEELSDERFVSEEYTSDEDEEDLTEDEDSWDLIDAEVQLSDSASRPQHHAGHRQQQHRAAPQAPSVPSAPDAHRPRQSRRASSRHAVPAPDPRSAHHSSRSRSRGPQLAREQRPRRRRQQSHQQPPADSLGEEETGDDYPYGAPPPHGGPPGHPTSQWSHIQPAPGYAPSQMSYHDSHYYGGASPAGALVGQGFHGYEPNRANGFSPQGPNPFAAGPDYFQGAQGQGGTRANRRSMGAPPPPPSVPSDAMMPYSQHPMGGHPGYPPPQGYGYPPYAMVPPGFNPYQQHHSPPPEDRPHGRRSKSHRGTPRPQSSHFDHSDGDSPQATPAPPPQQVVVAAPLPPPPPPPPPDTSKEDAMLKKLNDLLLGKAEEEARKEAEARKAAELAKFERLENLLIAQQEAQIAKDKAKQQAALDAAKAAVEAKKKGDEDKLANLEKLILAQKDEQLKREAAAEAERKAVAEAADAEAKKIAEEKKAAAEAAKLLLDAATKAREEAEKEAAKKAEETKAAHDKALAEAKAAAEELEKAKKAAEEEAAKLKPSDAPKAPIKFKDAVGRKFSFPWHLCKTWKGMEELIKQAFLHVDIIGPHVHQGHYDLVGPDGEIILPQVWETMIQPDWNITMHMWPMPEPKEELPPPPPPMAIPVDAVHYMGHSRPGKPPKKGSSSKHKISKVMPDPMVVMPPPPPPPPMGPGGGGTSPPAVVVMPAPSSGGSSHKPKKKPAPGGFFAWAAGGNGRSGSVKKNSKKA